MMSEDNGGPAFPHNIVDDALHYKGMTLRDYFAAKAMQGCWANTGPDYGAGNAAITAKWAYQMADAMLAERAK